MVKGHKGVCMHWCHWGPQEEEKQQQQRCWLGCHLWVPPGPPAELLSNVGPGVPRGPATPGGGTGGTGALAWQTHGHCCPMLQPRFRQAKQHSVVPNLVQGKALNEPTLAPLEIWLCWAGYKILSWQISRGHWGPESGTWGWSRFDFKCHTNPLTTPRHLSSSLLLPSSGLDTRLVWKSSTIN